MDTTNASGPIELLTIDGAAARMNTSVKFVRRLVSGKRIEHLKLGHRTIRIPAAAVERFMAASLVKVKAVVS